MDPTIGRFMTPDPLADFVTYQSPYAMAENNPVLHVDVEGLGILNVIGNLWKRLKLAVKKACSGNSCSSEQVQESIRDAWVRPDFPRKGRKRRSRRKNRSKNRTKASPSRSKASGINVNSNGVVNGGITDFGSLSLNSLRPSTSPEIPDIGGIPIRPDQVTSVPIKLNFGSLSLGTSSEVISRNTQLGNDAITQNSLEQIAKVLLMNPNIRMRIDFANPDYNFNGKGRFLKSSDKNQIRLWNRLKFQRLARFLKNKRGIDQGRILYGERKSGGRLIFY